MMKRRLHSWFCALVVLAMTPVTALAARPEMEKEIVDARLEGYDKVNVTLAPSGTALTWLLLIFLTAVTVSVMFKDAKRSHLD
jgi:hypothetical protein